MDVKAQIVQGDFDSVIARKKSDADVSVGELLVYDDSFKIIFQVHDLFYASQISGQNLERISGLNLEEGREIDFINEEQRNYLMIRLKPLLSVRGDVKSPKTIPPQFSELRALREEDLSFMKQDGLSLGQLRNGRDVLDIDASVDLEKALSHHILVSGTTGKGKSVLMKNLLWECSGSKKVGNLVFDPHDEYYGRNSFGLKDRDVRYYTPKDVPAGGNSLVFDLRSLRPRHFMFSNWSDAQRQALYYFYRNNEDWIRELFVVDPEKVDEVNELTLIVLRRKLQLLLDLDVTDRFKTNGVFKVGKKGVTDSIVEQLEKGETVIVDTSIFDGGKELLISSIITEELFGKYKWYNNKDVLDEKPVINITLEEAPRVLGKDVLENGNNVFSSIAREGRKFKVGLTAITQMPSLIPKQLLANMNTKIILGTEMRTERNALIESSNQDLSKDERNIASLNVGEAIVTSSFTKFAMPVDIPLFEEKKDEKEYKVTGLK